MCLALCPKTRWPRCFLEFLRSPVERSLRLCAMSFKGGERIDEDMCGPFETVAVSLRLLCWNTGSHGQLWGAQSCQNSREGACTGEAPFHSLAQSQFPDFSRLAASIRAQAKPSQANPTKVGTRNNRLPKVKGINNQRKQGTVEGSFFSSRRRISHRQTTVGRATDDSHCGKAIALALSAIPRERGGLAAARGRKEEGKAANTLCSDRPSQPTLDRRWFQL